jgi:hypothetical protein
MIGTSKQNLRWLDEVQKDFRKPEIIIWKLKNSMENWSWR